MWVWPESELLESAVRSGGGSVVPLEQANAIVCTGDDVELLRRSILPGVRWVQLGRGRNRDVARCGPHATGRRLDGGERRLRETDRRAHPGADPRCGPRATREGTGTNVGNRGWTPRGWRDGRRRRRGRNRDTTHRPARPSRSADDRPDPGRPIRAGCRRQHRPGGVCTSCSAGATTSFSRAP